MAGAMSEMRVANDLLADPVRLRARFGQDGYLLFRDVLAADAVRGVGEELVRILASQGLVSGGGPVPTWIGGELTESGERGLQELFNEQALWEGLVAAPAVAGFFAQVAGGPVGFIPLARYRVMPPGGATQVHQDALLNPGFAMTTAWIPLMGIDEELGGLAVAVGSHRWGCMAPESLPPLAGLWRSVAYGVGDVVLMHEALVHTGLANRSGSGLRLSVDVRYQDPSAPAAVVGPIVAAEAGSVRIAAADGSVVELAVDDSTLLRASTGARVARSEVAASELVAGRRVIASRRGGVAVMVKPL